MTAGTIARLKITLDGVEPAVLRRVDVPCDIRLDRLHLVIQAAMGWGNCHLYMLRAGDLGWSTPDPDDPDDLLDARKARLDDVLDRAGTKTLTYLYDFGDDWRHTVTLERLLDAEPGALYPRLVEATGRCPPEDVGGAWGYAEFLEAIHNRKHERHAEFKEWWPGKFDVKEAGADRLQADVAALARRWTRRSRTRA
jgi:hypothetical protein